MLVATPAPAFSAHTHLFQLEPLSEYRLAGQSQLETLLEANQHESCWTRAIASLRSGCRTMALARGALQTSRRIHELPLAAVQSNRLPMPPRDDHRGVHPSDD